MHRCRPMSSCFPPPLSLPRVDPVWMSLSGEKQNTRESVCVVSFACESELSIPSCSLSRLASRARCRWANLDCPLVRTFLTHAQRVKHRELDTRTLSYCLVSRECPIKRGFGERAQQQVYPTAQPESLLNLYNRAPLLSIASMQKPFIVSESHAAR